MEIILVDIGIFQPYILDNIRNLKLFENYNITVITSDSLQENFRDVNVVMTSQLNSFEFDKLSQLEGDFWKNASKRLFYIYSYMKKFNKTNCIHIENDYLLYFQVDQLKFNKVMVTIDDGERCIPGIVCIPNAEMLKPLIENYNFKENDMINMYRFYKNNEHVECLPTSIDSSNYTNLIFDAAAIGQYLGGIDPIHEGGGIPGYINPLFNINFSKYDFYWKKVDDLYIPCIKINGNIHKIAGLHIHSKQLQNFQGDEPIEQRLIKITKIDFISFAEGSQDYYGALKRIENQALSLNFFSSVETFKKEKLYNNFWNKHREFIEKNSKGYGYYIWKPYIILEQLNKLEDSDILWYADAGCEIDCTKRNLFVETVKFVQKNCIACGINCQEREYTKRDLLIYMNMDLPCYTDDFQYEATSICFKKCKKVMDFVTEWCRITQHYNLIDESVSINSEYPDFRENRYDQSVFSLLMKRYFFYDRTFFIGKAIELSRNRTGRSLLPVNKQQKQKFDWKQYVLNYPDLYMLTNEHLAIDHWNRFGKRENRTFLKN